ncbi:MAG: hypothetical protein WBW48_10010 [Anaerolineae bacterium]
MTKVWIALVGLCHADEHANQDAHRNSNRDRHTHDHADGDTIQALPAPGAERIVNDERDEV